MKAKLICLVALLPYFLTAQAQNSADAGADRAAQIEAQQQQLQQQRLQELQRQQQSLQRQQETQLSIQQLEKYDITQEERTCFRINQIDFEDSAELPFRVALDKTLRQVGYQEGMCLGPKAISYIAKVLQNKIIAKGYITTRVLTPSQDLTGGRLIFKVLVGRVKEVKYVVQEGEGFRNFEPFGNALNIRSGDILNLRDIEQGLENLKRVPTVDASMNIEPADDENMSNIIITWSQQAKAMRFSTSIDDSGSKSTGKYQISETISVDNLFGLSDLFYVNIGHSLFNGESIGDLHGSSRSYALHYSVPYGYWLAQININGYKYKQAVDAANFDGGSGIMYSGRSRGGDVQLSRILHRSPKSKTTATVKGWVKSLHSYIYDAQVDTQRKRIAGWEAALEQKLYLGRNTFIGKLSYTRGTGWANALHAFEEQFGEGTSRMKILTLDLNANIPFTVANNNFSYDGRFKAQWNRNELLIGEYFSIGGRYTVRGFDGESVLSAPRGWFLTNDITWYYKNNHWAFFGLDVGRVNQTSQYYPSRKSLLGAVLGLRGQVPFYGTLNYELFISKALKQPVSWGRKKWLFGFSVSHAF